MCCCSFVKVGAFKKLVFVFLDFGRTCFILFWIFSISIWLFIEVFVWICRISIGRRRKLKKVCCDSEVQQKNVVASKLAIREQNAFRIEELRVDETINKCNLKLDMVIVSNPTDEIPPKTNWNF